VLTEAIAEHALRNHEQARRLRSYAFRLRQRILKELLFIRLECFAQTKHRHRRVTGCLDLEREMMVMNYRAGREDHSSFDRLTQLPHVAGPIVIREHVHRTCRHAPDAAHVLARKLLDEQLRQNGKVTFALAKRRYLNRECAEALPQISSASAGRGLLFEVARCRRDDADIRRHPQAVGTLPHALLCQPDQCVLRERTQIGDIVEKQRAPLGAPRTSGGGSSRTLAPSEQLGVDVRFDHGRAVHGDERTGGSR
jgi:hypothetical protein